MPIGWFTKVGKIFLHSCIHFFFPLLQLSEYSKYGESTGVVQDITSNAQAVCEDRLKDEFFRKCGVHLYLSLTLFIPIIFTVILALVIRSIHPQVHDKLVKSPKHHPMLAGLTLAGTYLLVFILCMDCAALYNYGQREHEYKEDDVHKEFNLHILGITFALDAIVSLQFLACMLYLCCIQTYSHDYCKGFSICLLEKIIPICTIPYFYAIFGRRIRVHTYEKANVTIENANVKVKNITIVVEKGSRNTNAVVNEGRPTVENTNDEGRPTVENTNDEGRPTVENTNDEGRPTVENTNDEGRPTVENTNDEGRPTVENTNDEGRPTVENTNDEGRPTVENTNDEGRPTVENTNDATVENTEVNEDNPITVKNISITVENATVTAHNVNVTIDSSNNSVTVKYSNVTVEKNTAMVMKAVTAYDKDGETTNNVNVMAKKFMVNNGNIAAKNCMATVQNGNGNTNATDNIIVTNANVTIANRPGMAKTTTVWVITSIMVAPLFALASHVGYILIAWVTEPVRTTATTFVGLGSFLYLYLLFRLCYTVYKQADENDRALFIACKWCSYKDRLTCKDHWITCFWLIFTIPLLPVWIIIYYYHTW